MEVNEPAALDLTISSYATQKYPFADKNDLHTLLQALQSPFVIRYLEHPHETRAPPEMTRLISPEPDTYLRGIAQQIVVQNMVASDDEEQREMLTAFNERKEGILKRGKFFVRILHKDMHRSRKVPYIFYPMLKACKPQGIVDQIMEILPNISSDVERVFFALLFKFQFRTKKEFVFEKIILLDWHTPRKDKEDPYYTVYMQASDALWDYIYHLRADGGAEHCENKTQLADAWIEWMRSKTSYTVFLNECFDGKNAYKFKRQISIWTRFLWAYENRLSKKRAVSFY